MNENSVKTVYTIVILVFVLSASIGRAKGPEQVSYWVKIFEVLATVGILTYIRKFKMKSTSFGQGILFGMIIVLGVAPIVFLSVGYLSFGFGYLFSLTPNEAMLQLTNIVKSNILGVRDAFVAILTLISTKDWESFVLSTKGVIHWWIFGTACVFLFISSVYKSFNR